MVTAEDKDMLGINNCDYTERERQVIELYDQGKSTRDIAKDLRMSLRDISAILRRNQVSHGIPIINNDSNDNNNIEWFVNMVKTGIYKIPEIQKQHAKAKDELEVIEYKRVMSKHELDNMNNQIILLRRSGYQLSTTCNNKRNEIAYLQNQ